MNKILFVIVLLCWTFYGFSQDMMTGISYNMGIPASDTRDYVKNYSWRGFGFQFRNLMDNNISWGASIDWNVFAEKTSKLINLEDGAIAGTQIRSLNTFSLMLNADYYLGDPHGRIQPYIGLNTGTYYIIQRLEIGIIAPERENWHFGLAPEIGIINPTDNGTNLFFNARYNYAFSAGTYLGNEGKDWSYWGFNVGLSFNYNYW